MCKFPTSVVKFVNCYEYAIVFSSETVQINTFAYRIVRMGFCPEHTRLLMALHSATVAYSNAVGEICREMDCRQSCGKVERYRKAVVVAKEAFSDHTERHNCCPRRVGKSW